MHQPFQAKNIKLNLISDTFRFQEQSPSKAGAQRPDSEEEFGQEDEVSDRISNLSVKSTDELEGKMPHSDVSGSSHCKSNSFTKVCVLASSESVC